MKRLVILVLAAGCGPKGGVSGPPPGMTPVPIATIAPDELTESERARATPTPVATATPESTIAVEAVSEDELPEKATLLWKAERPLDVDKSKILVKDGVLKKVAAKENEENQTRHYPYAIDYWGITRADIAELLEKNVGKPIRLKGHYRKIWSDGSWTYEVDPYSIVLLPSLP